MISDSRSGSTYAYTYNNAARLSSLTYEGNTRGSYVYNGLSQLITRTVSNMGSGVDGTVHYVHDAAGNIIAETDGTGATVREYIWIPGVGYAGVALPIAVVDGVNTATPAVYYVQYYFHSQAVLRCAKAHESADWYAFGYTSGGRYTASVELPAVAVAGGVAIGANKCGCRLAGRMRLPARRPASNVSPGNGFKLKRACITTGTGITMRASAATRSLIRWALLMGRVCTPTRATIRRCMWIQGAWMWPFALNRSITWGPSDLPFQNTVSNMHG